MMKIKPVHVQSLEIKGFAFSWVEEKERVLRACFCSPEDLRREFPEAKPGWEGEIYHLLLDYASGRKVALEEVPVVFMGSDFQERVWSWIRRIKYGERLTYSQVAEALGTSPRAVGRALASNKIPLFIPCHRVVGKANLGGFTPDVKIKRMLLELEGGSHDKNGTLEGS